MMLRGIHQHCQALVSAKADLRHQVERIGRRQILSSFSTVFLSVEVLHG